MALQVPVSGRSFTDWSQVLDHAYKGEIYAPSLFVGEDGLVYGESADGLVILGRWGGEQSPLRSSPQNIMPGLFGEARVPLPKIPGITWPKFPLWLLLLIAVGAVIIIRKA